jgi:trans-aconitate methyltransferase
MHLVPDQKRALHHFKQLLKPNGRLLLKFPNSDGFSMSLEKVMQLPQWKDRFAHFHSGWFFRTKEEYIQLISEAGLKLIHIEQGVLDENYDTPQELAAAVREWLPHLQILSPIEQDEFLDDLLMFFLKEVPPDAEGKVHHYEPFLLVEATIR